MNSIPEEIYYYGSSESLPEQYKLKAGPLQVIYEKGIIRYVKLNNYEVLRMIYPAVRDENWGTIVPGIRNEKIIDNKHSFLITYEALYNNGDISFVSHYRISGEATGKISFTMKGKALSTFRKNRIGLNVLHPAEDCAGNSCEVVRVSGEKVDGHFPEIINPDQPFKDIRAMRWPLPGNSEARLEFEGDIFEMEDQRNWTDASFKTYSTPLDLPFPVTIEEGAEIDQQVTLIVRSGKNAIDIPSAVKTASIFDISDTTVSRLPMIGVGRSDEVSELSQKDISKIRKAGFHHYRINVKLFEPGWEKGFCKAADEAKQLKLELEIALHLPEKKHVQELKIFVEECLKSDAAVYAIIIFQKNAVTTPDRLINEVTPLLRENLPSARIGGGTDEYFTELNRNRIQASPLDFVSYSINPQVHAFDNTSLVETMQAQGYTVQSTRDIFSKKPVHVSPVTLKPRFNPSATGPEAKPPPDQLPRQVDVRQMSLFGAGWTLGSIKYLAEAGAESITYYETVGGRGLFMNESSCNYNNLFPAGKGDVFPLYSLLKDVLEYSGAEVRKSSSNTPLQFDGLALKSNGSLRVILASYIDKEIKITIPSVEGTATIRQVNAEVLKNKDWLAHNNPLPLANKQGFLTVILQPYAFATIDVKLSLT